MSRLLITILVSLVLTGCMGTMMRIQDSDEAKKACIAATIAVACLQQAADHPELNDPAVKQKFREIQHGLTMAQMVACPPPVADDGR